MGIWATFFKFQNKNMQKQKWYEGFDSYESF